MSSEALSVALAEFMENADWKMKLDGTLEETDIRVQQALDQREEVFRLETDKIRGMESHLETQVSRDVRYCTFEIFCVVTIFCQISFGTCEKTYQD